MLLLSTFLTPHAARAQAVIDAITFHGLKKTKADYLYQFIQSTPGSVYDAGSVDSDIQSLRNSLLFSRVESRRETVGGKTRLVFEVEERITRLPITNFGGITDNFWLQLGINDYNWLGRGGYFGGYYQYYDRHSFKVFSMMPALFGDRWGLSYIIGKQATREPAYFSGSTVDFDVDRWEITALARYELFRNLGSQNFWTLESGGGYLNETYTQLPHTVLDFPQKTRFQKLFLKTVLSHRRLNHYSHHVDGISQQSTLEYVHTMGETGAFWKWRNAFHFFRRLGQRGNPAMRIIAGIASNDNTPFVPFVLDSYLNVRGSGNRVARGTSELTVNLEHRHTVFEASSWALEAVAFLDASAWRPGKAPLSVMFRKENIVSFAGGGGRLHLRKIYNFSLRLDYGISTSNPSTRGFVLGVGQYF